LFGNKRTAIFLLYVFPAYGEDFSYSKSNVINIRLKFRVNTPADDREE